MPQPEKISSHLEQILERKRETILQRRRSCSESKLLKRCESLPTTRDFVGALSETVTTGQPAIIAEIKKASPSKGPIFPESGALKFDAARIADSYARNGATCLSCLTEEHFFQGDDTYLTAARKRVDRPILRKDFIETPYQIVEARAIGADAVLLIVAILSRDQARELESVAHELGLAVLLEVHDERELEAAHDLTTPLIGINNRNLKTFEVHLETTIRLMRQAESNRLIVSESGIQTPKAMRKLRENGVQAFLMGEVFMRHPDPGEALQDFLRNLDQITPHDHTH